MVSADGLISCCYDQLSVDRLGKKTQNPLYYFALFADFDAMTQSNSSVLTGNDVHPNVQKVWEAVFRSSAVVIVHAKKFGFTGMDHLDPDIDQLLTYMYLVVGAIDALLNSATVSPEEARLLLNAKKQIGNLESVAKMLQLGDVDGFDKAMRELESQAHH